MPIRFSTEAANADRINPDGEPAGSPPSSGSRSPYDRPLRPKAQKEKSDEKADAGKAGKDINAAGFLKDPSPSTD
ncbi:MAG: hypothetical protein V4787_25045 [Pseudomonadota bacterium]